MCTTDAIEIQFNPGSWREWIWEFDPTVYGLAAVDGKVNVIGYYPGTAMVDTLQIEAPAYVGGHVAVKVLSHVTADDLQPVLDSLNVTVLESEDRSNGRSERWHIDGTTVSAAIDTYASDSRFGWFETPMLNISWTMVDTEPMPERPNASPSLSVYPNPCRAQCEIDYSGSPDGRYRLDVFDSQGRAVSTPDNPDAFDASDLPAGVYFVRVVTQEASISKPFTVIR
ncbi:MAG: T9SS type A sorting domain-containing protein [Rhodothermales bacterium]